MRSRKSLSALPASRAFKRTCGATLQSWLHAIEKCRQANTFQNSNFTGWRKRWVWLSWQPIGTEVWSGSVAPPPVQIPPWLWRQYTSTREHDASLQVNSCAVELIEAPQAEILQLYCIWEGGVTPPSTTPSSSSSKWPASYRHTDGER